MNVNVPRARSSTSDGEAAIEVGIGSEQETILDVVAGQVWSTELSRSLTTTLARGKPGGSNFGGQTRSRCSSTKRAT